MLTTYADLYVYTSALEVRICSIPPYVRTLNKRIRLPIVFYLSENNGIQERKTGVLQISSEILTKTKTQQLNVQQQKQICLSKLHAVFMDSGNSPKGYEKNQRTVT